MAGPNLFSTHLSTTDTDTQQELSSEEKISKAVKREQAALRQAREAKQKLSAVQNDQERGQQKNRKDWLCWLLETKSTLY